MKAGPRQCNEGDDEHKLIETLHARDVVNDQELSHAGLVTLTAKRN